MVEINLSTLVPIIVSLIGFLGSLIGVYLMNRRDSLSKAADAWESFVEPLQKRVGELEEESTRNRREIRRLREEVEFLSKEYKRVVAGVAMLTNQLVAAGLEPIFKYTVPDRDKKD